MTTIQINVGRIFTTARGLFGIRLDDGTEVTGPQGSGMNKETAEAVLDAIELRQARRLAKPVAGSYMSAAGF